MSIHVSHAYRAWHIHVQSRIIGYDTESLTG